MCVCIHTYMYINLRVYIHIYIYIYAHICILMYVYMYVYVSLGRAGDHVLDKVAVARRVDDGVVPLLGVELLRRREHMVGVNMVLEESVKLKHGLCKSCGAECFEGILLEPCLLQPCSHVAGSLVVHAMVTPRSRSSFCLSM